MNLFDLSRKERLQLWEELTGLLEEYYSGIASASVSPKLDFREIVDLAGKYSFDSATPASESIAHVIEGIKKYGVQVGHPSYYGLFNPRPNFAGIMADMITATLNPQIAAWSHAPFAAEVENYLIQVFGKKFGYPSGSIDGVFCGGGAEANHTALLCAINHAVPTYAKEGLNSANRKVVIYCSAEAHHSIGKAAMLTGLGLEAVTSIPADNFQRMRPDLLEKQIEKDLKNNLLPIMVVATTGTTGSGAVDPLVEIGSIAKRYKLWFHADAAYGGAAILDPELSYVLNGIENTHSITFDMHKWMSVPMGTSIFLTRDAEILFKTFRITTDYMPREADSLEVTDPYIHSMQWSRRFIGLRTYLSLLIFGWEGYAKTIHHQVEMGNYLQDKLIQYGWKITNSTDLPVVCFTDPAQKDNDHFADQVCKQVLESGRAWVSVYPVNGVKSIRACITNYATTTNEIDDFIFLVNECR